MSSESAFAPQRDSISDYEQQACAEFFQGKAAKTPARYLLIRNHILDEWQRTRPAYLTKIRARSGLRNCGDVNAIGRVHAFLERCGAINKDALHVPHRIKRKRAAEDAAESSSSGGGSSGDEAVGLRRRRRPAGGHVIEHTVVERNGHDDGDYRCSSGSSDEGGRRRRRRRHWAASGIATSDFRLVPYAEYSASRPQPYALHVSSAALALMDLHAHLTHAEVIGLLGGRVSSGAVHVDVAFACGGAGSATECEMDAQAEVAARRWFARRGLAAVGWFHSHPAFEPTPSVRDIATQRAYQALCAQPDGSEPFVGIIVSPPGGDACAYGVSDIRAFSVPRDTPTTPWAVAYEVGAEGVPEGLVGQMEELVRTQAGALAQRADLSRRFRRKEAMTALEKLVLSMRSHWAEHVRQQWDDAVSLRLRPLLVDLFCKGGRHDASSASSSAYHSRGHSHSHSHAHSVYADAASDSADPDPDVDADVDDR
ncbi:hypothetical protein GGI15_001871 [Coemansia interrupta]|uniref:Myb-like, SWIRM and MPN domain-containing protein 1 n=1 Tax=Coemansia interrupta TaxID=1126814 RepID=A0A9W8HI90_9FUNG|nr:hypothetical protein GGI15_001871 [Coemansia interrupta]